MTVTRDEAVNHWCLCTLVIMCVQLEAALQNDQCMTSKYRESDSKASGASALCGSHCTLMSHTDQSAELTNVSGYVCNHGSPSGERDTASPRGHYGERLQRDSCLKKHMKKHHPLAGDSPWRHYRRDHNIRTAGRIHHPLLRLKLAFEAWPQSLGDAVSRSPLGEPWLHT